jgi:hypothetical protein
MASFDRKFPVFSRRSGNFSSGDSFAAVSQHSHLVAGFSALSRHTPNAPREAPNCATNPASGFSQLAIIMGLAFVLVCLFFVAREIRWYTSLFLIYMIMDFLTLRYVHGIIRHAVDGSYERLREDRSLIAELHTKAIRQIEHYYFVRPHDLRRFIVVVAMGIACWLAFQGSNGDIFEKLAYGLSIVTVTASEIVIGYWRQVRDNGLHAVETSLAKARRQGNTSSSRGASHVRKRRQSPRIGRAAS